MTRFVLPAIAACTAFLANRSHSYCVVAVRRNAAYEVTWIEILHVHRDLCALEVRDDLFLQVNAYVRIGAVSEAEICGQRQS